MCFRGEVNWNLGSYMCAKSHTEFHPMYLFSSDLKVRVLPCANRERLISERNMLSVVSQRHVMITREMENLVLLFFPFLCTCISLNVSCVQ